MVKLLGAKPCLVNLLPHQPWLTLDVGRTFWGHDQKWFAEMEKAWPKSRAPELRRLFQSDGTGVRYLSVRDLLCWSIHFSGLSLWSPGLVMVSLPFAQKVLGLRTYLHRFPLNPTREKYLTSDRVGQKQQPEKTCFVYH